MGQNLEKIGIQNVRLSFLIGSTARLLKGFFKWLQRTEKNDVNKW